MGERFSGSSSTSITSSRNMAGMRNSMSGRGTDLVAVGALSWGVLGHGVVIFTSAVCCFNRFGVNSATEGVDPSISNVSVAPSKAEGAWSSFSNEVAVSSIACHDQTEGMRGGGNSG